MFTKQTISLVPQLHMRVVPKVMSNFFLHANWEQQTKESMVVDGTSCCVILELLVTSIACITWPVSLLTKWPTTICRFASVLSSNFLLKRKYLLQKFTRDFSVLMEVCAWVRAVFEDNINNVQLFIKLLFRCLEHLDSLELRHAPYWGVGLGYNKLSHNVIKDWPLYTQ